MGSVRFTHGWAGKQPRIDCRDVRVHRGELILCDTHFPVFRTYGDKHYYRDFSVTGIDDEFQLPAGIVAEHMAIKGCPGLKELPDDLRVEQTLFVEDCAGLTALGARCNVGELHIRSSPKLAGLPSDLTVSSMIDIDGISFARNGIVIQQAIPDAMRIGCVGKSVRSVIDHYMLSSMYLDDPVIEKIFSGKEETFIHLDRPNQIILGRFGVINREAA